MKRRIAMGRRSLNMVLMLGLCLGPVGHAFAQEEVSTPVTEDALVTESAPVDGSGAAEEGGGVENGAGGENGVGPAPVIMNAAQVSTTVIPQILDPSSGGDEPADIGSGFGSGSGGAAPDSGKGGLGELVAAGDINPFKKVADTLQPPPPPPPPPPPSDWRWYKPWTWPVFN